MNDCLAKELDMRISVEGLHREKKHMANLRLKLRRELPDEYLDHCETFAKLEARKKEFDAIKAWDGEAKDTRTREERLAMKYERLADDWDSMEPDFADCE